LTAGVNDCVELDPNCNQKPRETPVTSYMSSKFHDLAEPRSGRTSPARSEPTAAATKLQPGAGLLLTLFLSLGLWVAIWQAVSSLTAAWLH
jgi:hypothetical protein